VMNLFIAVIYLCVGPQCTFLQSEGLYRTEYECLLSAAQAAKELKQKNPGAVVDGACIVAKFTGA